MQNNYALGVLFMGRLKYITKICENCNKEFLLLNNFYKRRRRFCSKKCANVYTKTIKRHIRICACGCNKTFECKNNSNQKYIWGHFFKTELARQKSRETIIKINKSFKQKIKVSNRMKENNPNKSKIILNTCLFCNKQFITSLSLKRVFCSFLCHKQYMSIFNPMKNKEIKAKQIISFKNRTEKQKKKSYEKILATRLRNKSDEKISKRMKENNPMHNLASLKKMQISLRRNKINKLEKEYIELFNNIKKLKFVGNAKKFIAGKNPDFIDGKNKKIVEISSYNFDRNKTTYALPRIAFFEKFGYNVMVIFHKYHKMNMEDVLRETKIFLKSKESIVYEYNKITKI